MKLFTGQIVKQTLMLLLALVMTTAMASEPLAVKSVANPPAPLTPTAPPKPPMIIPPAPAVNAKSYLLMDYQTGQILAQKNIHQQRAPASLTKLMTLYLVFSAIHSGQITLDDKVRISKVAWKTGGSRMFIKAGNRVSVDHLIQGVIVDSGNDATVALAEFLAGSQQAFVPLMNQQAQALAMNNTHFADVNGLPMKSHHSSAYDLSLLTRAIISGFPQQYHFFKQKHFTWNKIKQTNRNWLLFRDPTVDGLKTGHTDGAGYCLIASAQRNGTRLISVVLGAPTETGRVDASQRLLNYGFRFYTTQKIYPANTAITQARVWGGVNKNVALGLSEDLFLVVPKGQYKDLKLNLALQGQLHAPIIKGQTYGKLTVSLHGKELASRPVVALANDVKGGLWTRFSDYVSMSFHKLF